MVGKTESFAALVATKRARRCVRRMIGGHYGATALAGGLAATILLAVPAAAQTTRGGSGGRGSSSLTPPPGGTSSDTGTGQNGATGTNFQGGAGGGAGAAGGAGGAAPDGTLGGTGGTTAGEAGHDGTGAYYASGGGGGAHGAVLATTTTPGVDVAGGRGGNGANASGGDGGGGGAGGFGVVVSTGGTFFFDHLVTGGAGGNGGVGYFYGGGGGYGGYGLLFTGSATATINGAVAGGNGGSGGGFIASCCAAGAAGAGGIGIVGSNLSLTLNAAVAGGLAGDGVTRALALRLGGDSSLTLGAGGSITGGIEIAGGTLTFAQATNVTLANAISGTGALTKTGAGILTLSGANTYSGGTTISGGTLKLGGAASYGSGTITLDGGTLDLGSQSVDMARLAGGTGTILASAGGGLALANGTSATFGSGGGSITSGLALSVGSTSTLTMRGNNDLTGGITLAGRLVIAQSGGAGGSGNTITTTGSVISYADGVDSAAAILIASNTTQLEVVGSDIATQSGTISEDQPGRGFEKIGTGTLILTGTNSYTGATTVSAGTLALGNDAAAGTGQILLGDGTRLLNASCGCGTLALSNAIAVTGTATIDTDGYDSLLSGNLTGGDINFADTFGGGSFVLTGANSYGATTVGVGATLRVGDGGTTGTLGTGSITTDGMLAFDRSDLVTLSTGVAGTGALGQFGTGTLVLTGTNSYSGGTVILDPDGTLQVGDGGTTGTLGTGQISISGGTLVFNRSDDMAVADDIVGDGLITKLGAGTLTLTGDNSLYSGAMSILGGTVAFTETGGYVLNDVEIDNGAQLRPLEDALAGFLTVLSGGATIDTNGHVFEVLGSVDFQGELTKTGAGTLLLTDTFEGGDGAGGINVLQGTLGLGSDYAGGTGIIKLADGTTLLNATCGCASSLNIDNAIEIALGGIVTFDGAGENTNLNGAISGGDIRFTTSVSAPFAGSRFRLNGANSYGETQIGPNVAVIVRDGTLGTGNVVFDATPSDPTTPAALVFQNTADLSFAGRIVGAGIVSIEADPDRSVTLTGSNSASDNFTGSVDVISGRLVINGDFGDVVGNSATLVLDDSCGCGGTAPSIGGSGIFHGNVSLGTAQINPGNSPGTLAIAGNLTLGLGTVLNYELGAPGMVGGLQNDLVTVGGNLTLDGTLNTIASGAGYGPGYYRLFNYGGTLTDNGLAIGSIAGGLDASVLTNISGQVNVRLGGAQAIQYWDGADMTGSSTAAGGNGGSGIWNGSSTNWTGPTGFAINDAWESQVGVFAGAAGGTVTVDGTQGFEELRFETDGYLLRPADASARLNTTGGFSIVGVSAGVTADIGVVIQGGAGLDKTGDGTLILSAVNTYTGATDVAGGVLRLGIDDAIAQQSALTVSAGATLDIAGFSTKAGALAGAGTVTLGTGGRLDFGYDGSSTNFGGTLTADNGVVTQNGAGSFTLSGSMALGTDTGQLTINNGSFAIAGGGSFTGFFLQSYATFTNAGTVDATVVQTFAATTNTGTVNATIQSFSTIDNSGTIGSLSNFGSGTNSGTIAGSLTNFSSFTSTGIVNGDASNFGTLLLQGQVNGEIRNQQIGATVTLTGTLAGATNYVSSAGALFDLAGFDTTVGALNGNEGDIHLGSATLTIDGGLSFSSFSGVISGSGGLIKTGAGQQTLSGQSSYTGATAVNGGRLDLYVGGALTSDVTIAGAGTFANAGTVTGLLTNSGTLYVSGIVNATGPFALVNNSGGTASAHGQINGVVQNAGAFLVDDTLTGITQFSQSAGGQLTLGSDFALGALDGLGTVDTGGFALSIGAGNANSSFGGAVSGAGGLTKTGTGTFTLTGTNSYTGQTLVSEGALVLGSAGTITGQVANNATFQSNGVVLGGLVNNGTAQVQGRLDGPIANQSGSIVLTGAIAGNGAINQAGGAQFDLAGFNASFGSLTGDGTVALGGGRLTIGSDGGDTSFAGAISGSGGLTKTGTGTMTLTGANSYSGTTMIDGGTLRLTDLGSVGANTVVNNGTLTFDGATDQLFANVITGSGNVTKSGTAVTILTGASSYSGGTQLLGGTLAFTNGQALGTGDVDLADATELRAGAAGPITLANDIAVSGSTATLSGTGGSHTTFGGSVTGGDIRFAVAGAGNAAFTLDGANNYGATGIGAGVSLTVAGGTLGIGDVVLDDPSASLTFANAASYNYGGVISGAGAIVIGPAAGATITLSGSNSAAQNFTGTVTIDSGELVLNGEFGDVVANTASLILDGGALGGSGTFHGDVTVGGGTLIPGNSPGTLNIAGNLTLDASAVLNYELGEAGTAGGANNDLINIGGNLTLDGTLNVTALPTFGAGYYRLFNYGGALTDNGLLFGALPAGYTGSLRTNISGQVNILFSAGGQAIQYWDGGDLSGASTASGGDGGAGTWNAASSNWTAPTGYGVNDSWRGQVAVFGGAAGGDVTVQGTQAFQELRFRTGGYAITGASAADGLAISGGFAVIDVDSGADARIDAVISGGGGLTKTGTGMLSLGGANSYAGTTTVSDGTLMVLAGGSLAGGVVNDAVFDNRGTIAGQVVNNATLSSTGVLDGGLDNRGSASIRGVLNGAVINTTSGAITLTGTTAGIGAVTQSGNGSFDLAGFDTSFGSLAGTGSVALGNAVLTLGGSNASTGFSGTISGSGGLTKIGTGTFTLSGVNSYSGLTTVSAGTLQLTGALAGAVRNDATFNNSGAVAGLATNNGTLASAGTLAGGLDNRGTASIAGTLNGTIANSGAIGLIGTTTGIGAVTQAGGSFALNGFDTTIGSLAGTGTVDLGSALLTLGGNDGSTSFAGVISGSGGLTKTGTGTLTLGGVNLYTGLTTVSAGMLALDATGALAGNLRNQASFANAGTVAGVVQNDGTLTSTGNLAGGLVNNGTASLQGQVGTGIVNNGTVSFTGTAMVAALQQAASGSFNLGGSAVSLGTLAGAGAIDLGTSTLTIGAGNGNSSFGGTISGAGALTKTGTGTLVLTGAATQTGGTMISGGALQIGSGGTTGALAGAITNNGILVLNRSDAVTLSNVMSGTGGFVQAGSGTTTLTGANSYSGGTLVSAGRLRGDAASLQGNIRIDAALEFGQTGAGTYAGSLSGAGLFEKSGTGSLSLTGDSSAFTGATHVLAGRLAVDGMLSHSIVTVGSGATLGGTGTAGGVVVQSGGTLAPGNSIGTFNVAGNVLFQTGSLLAAEVQASGSDRVQASGTAQLAGTLQVINLGGTYAINSSFVLLHADGGVSGTFDVANLSSFGLAFRPKLIYTANEVQLFLAPNQLSAVLGNVPLTYNQASTIGRIDAAVLAGYDPQALSALYGLAPAAIPAALDQLSGEVYADATRTTLEDERLVRQAVLGRLDQAADLALSGNGGWGQVIGSWGGVDGDGNAAGYDVDRTGLMMGIDAGAATDEGSWRAGVMGHYTHITLPASARGSRAIIDRTGGGFYAGAAIDRWRVGVGASLSLLDLKAARQIAIPGLAATERGKTQGVMLQTFGGIGYRIVGAHGFVEPYLQGSATRVRFDRFAERGGPAGLLVGRQKSVVGIAELGLRGETELGGVRLSGNIGMRAAFGDRASAPAVALADAPLQAFNIRSAAIDRFAGVGNLDLVVDLDPALTLRIGYNGVQGSGAHEHGGRAALSLRF